MRKASTLLTFCIGVVIGLGAIFLFDKKGESISMSKNNSPIISSAQVDSMEDEINALKQKLEFTQKKLAKAQQLASPEIGHQAGSEENGISSKKSHSPIDYQANAEAVQKHVRQMVERANRTGEFNLAEQASNAFEKAPRDERWADQHERDLQNAFAKEKPLQGAIIQATECKTRRCRITLFYQNKDEVGDISEQLTRLFSHSDDYDFVPASSVYFEDVGETATIFVADDINHLNTGVGKEPNEEG